MAKKKSKKKGGTKRLMGGVGVGATPVPKADQPAKKKPEKPVKGKPDAKPDPKAEKKPAAVAKAAGSTKPAKEEKPGSLLPDQEEWQKLFAQRTKVRKLEVEEAAAKSVHASLKKQLDDAFKQLGQVIDDVANPEKHKGVLPFPGTPAEKLSMAADQKPADPEAWRTAKLEALKLATSIEENLKAKGIHTLGDLAEAMKKGEGWYRDVPGVGKGKAETIEDALQGYWRDNKVEAPKAEPGKPTPAEVVANIVSQAEAAAFEDGKEWKTKALTSLKWAQGLRKKLKDAGITTLGALATALAGKGPISGVTDSEMTDLYELWTKALEEIRGSKFPTDGASGAGSPSGTENAAGSTPGAQDQAPAASASSSSATDGAASQSGSQSAEFAPGTYLCSFPGTKNVPRRFTADTQSELEDFVGAVCGVKYERTAWGDDGLHFLVLHEEEDEGARVLCVAKLVEPAPTVEGESE